MRIKKKSGRRRCLKPVKNIRRTVRQQFLCSGAMAGIAEKWAAVLLFWPLVGEKPSADASVEKRAGGFTRADSEKKPCWFLQMGSGTEMNGWLTIQCKNEKEKIE
ncbi:MULTISPECIES: hypothetical protein [unclassified Sporolactobacillus]|uniref:hypothetical protein n=1 Tax=unclassified Sporolactobacillus TaxID=2628533 RepID=UPI0023687CE0|nr:hypothetical protein [Sporolactobacillus sp. CQH2019]MDD9148044.1 hypothetical protein [Sporolactobacillus sp. CQH2019]